MTLEEHKAKILKEFWNEFSDGEYESINLEAVALFLSQAVDSTAEETYKAVRPDVIEYNWKSDNSVQASVLARLEDKWKEFKST